MWYLYQSPMYHGMEYVVNYSEILFVRKHSRDINSNQPTIFSADVVNIMVQCGSHPAVHLVRRRYTLKWMLLLPVSNKQKHYITGKCLQANTTDPTSATMKTYHYN